MDDLSKYISQEASKKYFWGRSDCMTFLAGWIHQRRGCDAMAAYAAAAVEHQRGRPMPVATGRAMRSLGLSSASAPRRGDVAILALPDGVVTGGIHLGRGWVMRLDTGVASASQARVIAAWGV